MSAIFDSEKQQRVFVTIKLTNIQVLFSVLNSDQ